MNLEEICDYAVRLAQSAQDCMQAGDAVAAYTELDSLHDLLLEHFVDLPKPEPS